mmetsp:Transcript_3077/g.6636  ORF Transcript_3077/g.6636 Transcript_3077/m.6636 type:complete len:219 (-) Transcript_3077:464-1120(-)
MGSLGSTTMLKYKEQSSSFTISTTPPSICDAITCQRLPNDSLSSSKKYPSMYTTPSSSSEIVVSKHPFWKTTRLFSPNTIISVDMAIANPPSSSSATNTARKTSKTPPPSTNTFPANSPSRTVTRARSETRSEFPRVPAEEAPPRYRPAWMVPVVLAWEKRRASPPVIWMEGGGEEEREEAVIVVVVAVAVDVDVIVELLSEEGGVEWKKWAELPPRI